MKKIKKILLVSSLSLMCIGTITPIVVSCSNNIKEPEKPLYIYNTDITRALFNGKDLKEDQFDFQFEIIDDKHFEIRNYKSDKLNFYDGKYTGSNDGVSDTSTNKSNVLLLPSKILYKGKWYSFGRIDSYLGERLVPELKRKVKSIRFDPTINYPIQKKHNSLFLNGLINLVDILDLPIQKEGEQIWTATISLDDNNLSFSNITINTNFDVPENVYTIFPVINQNWSEHLYELKKIDLYKINTIIDENFKYVRCPENFFIPDSVKYVGPSAFNESFKASVIPKKIYKDNINAWLFNKMIIDIDIPTGVKEIGDHAFYWSTFVNNFIKIPEGVVSVGEDAFASVSENVREIYLPDSLNYIDKTGFPFRPMGLYLNEVKFIVKSERIKKLLIDSATEAFKDRPDYISAVVNNIIINPNWDQKI